MQVETERIVEPGTEIKSGCYWCPLMPFSVDFAEHAASFQRDASKILEKNRDGHRVVSRCVSEEWTSVRALFVSEAPGRDEDKQSKPITGRNGSLLRRTIESATGLKADEYGFTNIVSCRTPRARDPNMTEVRSCSPRLIREIEERKPEVVVVFGNVALEFFTGQRGISSFAGKVLECTRPEFPGLKILACMSPGYVLRFDHELDRFFETISIVGEILNGLYRPRKGLGVYDVLTDIDEVERRLLAIRKRKKLTTFDTETGGLSPFQTTFPKMLCFSFSSRRGKGFVIPFDHRDAPDEFRKPGPIRARLKRALRRLFTDAAVPKAAQNEKFDRNHIRAALGVKPVNVVDTVMEHYVQDERQGTHDLTTQSYAHTGMGGYDTPLEHYKSKNPEADPKRGGSYANIPGEILFPYAAMDADATRRVHFGLIKEGPWKKNARLRRLATVFYPQLSDTLADVEWNGATIDQDMVKTLHRHYAKQMARIDKLIQADPKVWKFLQERKADNAKAEDSFNPDSWQQLGKVLFGYYKLRPLELNDSGMDKLKSRLEARTHEWSEAPGRKSLKDKPDFTSLVDEAIAKCEWDLFSTKADVLKEYEREGNPLVAKILEFRAFSTLQGTFIEPLRTKLDGKSRIHGTFMPHGTVTARLASRDPNLQNIPNKGGGRVKRCYVSRFGSNGLILQVDYSQIELRIAACLFKEPTMINAYRRGDDLHTLTAVAISKLTYEKFKALPKDKQKDWRTRAKRVNFGVLYGGGPPALVSTLAKDGVFITVEEAEDLIEAYFKARPTLKRNMDKLMAGVRKTGYLEAFTGHRRRVPEVFSTDEKLVARALRQSVNFPVQCGAAQMTNMALILIHKEMCRRKLRSKIMLTVHDSIVFDVHVDEMVEVGILAKHIMENLPKLSDSVMPGIDWSWLKVPIIADVDVGFTWGTCVELREVKVGKDAPRSMELDNLDIDYLWAAMEERLAA